MIKGKFPLERFKTLETPFYWYDMDLLRSTLGRIRSEMEANPCFRIHYAVKANFNPILLKEIASAGLGADCVSGGEIRAALEAGFAPEGIFFAGVGKTDKEIILALETGIGRFNVESEPELRVINDLALSLGVVAPVSFRVNPNVGVHTHANITTGLSENKFGIDAARIPEAISLSQDLPGVEFRGLHFHIGSQITDMADFEALCTKINGLRRSLEASGLPAGDINVGGGLGIEYGHPNHLPFADFDAYFDVWRKHLAHGPEEVHFELGRSIVAPCGSLISRVLYVKEGTARKFAILDAGMTDLIRPALYGAHHHIENASSDGEPQPYDVVGPVCESSDTFGKAVELSECHRGDFIAIRSAGAYGESMASTYNCRPLPKTYFSDCNVPEK